MVAGGRRVCGLDPGQFRLVVRIRRPVGEIVGDALWMTVLVQSGRVLFVYLIGITAGGARRRLKSETWVDYTAGFWATSGRDAELPLLAA